MGFAFLRGLAAVLLVLVVGGIGYAIGTHNGAPMMLGPDGAAQMHYYGHWGPGGGFHIFGFIFGFFLLMMLLRLVFFPWRHRHWGGGYGYWGGGPWGMRGGYWGGPMGPSGPMGGPGGAGSDEWQSHLDEMHRKSHERMNATSTGTPTGTTGNGEPPASAQ